TRPSARSYPSTVPSPSATALRAVRASLPARAVPSVPLRANAVTRGCECSFERARAEPGTVRRANGCPWYRSVAATAAPTMHVQEQEGRVYHEDTFQTSRRRRAVRRRAGAHRSRERGADRPIVDAAAGRHGRKRRVARRLAPWCLDPGPRRRRGGWRRDRRDAAVELRLLRRLRLCRGLLRAELQLRVLARLRRRRRRLGVLRAALPLVRPGVGHLSRLRRRAPPLSVTRRDRVTRGRALSRRLLAKGRCGGPSFYAPMRSALHRIRDTGSGGALGKTKPPGVWRRAAMFRRTGGVVSAPADPGAAGSAPPSACCPCRLHAATACGRRWPSTARGPSSRHSHRRCGRRSPWRRSPSGTGCAARSSGRP